MHCQTKNLGCMAGGDCGCECPLCVDAVFNENLADINYCGACYACLDDPSKGIFENPTNLQMVVCARCGNKRCPHAAHHVNACTDSNEPGQVATPGGAHADVKRRLTEWEHLARLRERHIQKCHRLYTDARACTKEALAKVAELTKRVAELEGDYAACAHAAGVEYVPDTGASVPGPVEAVVKAISETRSRVDFLEDRLAFRSAVKGHLR